MVKNFFNRIINKNKISNIMKKIVKLENKKDNLNELELEKLRLLKEELKKMAKKFRFYFRIFKAF